MESAWSRVHVLDRKLLRDLWRLRGQALAIALMIASGVAMAIMSYGMMRSLEVTRDAYYERYRFADAFAPVKRAPESLVARLREIPGVSIAESRITSIATLDIPGVVEPINARIHSLPPSRQPRLNALVLRSGRWIDPDKPDETLVNEAFFKASRLELGGRLQATLHGKQQSLRIVGVVLSPEYVYAIGPGNIFPDNRRFAVLWMGREHLAAALDLSDAFNELLIGLSRGAMGQDVLRRIDAELTRYGGTKAYGRDEQISDRFVSNELEELRMTTRVLPPIFLGIAAFLVNILLSRMVDSEREIIGLLKAFGYSNGAVLGHYLKLALALALPGLVVGSGLGAWLGRGLTGLYQEFFVFPFLQFSTDASVYLIAWGIALAAVLLGAAQAALRANRLTPAEAMRPPTPVTYGGWLARVLGRWKRLDELSRIILRGLLRRPVRAGLASLGIAAALGLYIASAGSMDNVEEMITLVFDRSERQDLTVTFAEARDERALHELERMPGVISVEPMRSMPANLRAGALSRREAITAAPIDATLSRPIGIDGRIVTPPPHGIILSRWIADKLRVKRGDLLQIEILEGRRPVFEERIAAVIDSPVGSPVVMDLAALNARLFEGGVASGANLEVDEREADALFRRLKGMPVIAGVGVMEAARRGVRDTIVETMGVVTLFNTGFAALIVFGVIYNNGRISLAERSRDLASLRILGFGKPEAVYILLGEQAVITLVAVPIGIGIGIALSRYFVSQFGGDMFSIPYALKPQTIAEAVVIMLIASALTALLLGRRINRLDLINVLKTRE